MSKLKFILTASIAAALTLSCSGDPEDDSGSSSSVGNESSSSSGTQVGGNVNPSSSSGGVNQPSEGNSSSSSGGGNPSNGDQNTEVYTLKSKTADQFTYIKVYEDEYCIDGGVLEIEEDTDENTVNYSINNNVMVWKWTYDTDTLNFKGTSNQFIGTWTRTKDKAASCEIYNDDENDHSRWECKDGWNITKAVFTETDVEITFAYCLTDEIMIDDSHNGWKYKIVNCNTYEMYKGTDKVMVEGNINSFEVSYKGESCKYEYELSKPKKEAACKEAWDSRNEYNWHDYYYDILRKDYFDCLERILPPELLDDEDEGDSYGEVAAKPVAKAKAKAKFMPLLKKKN